MCILLVRPPFIASGFDQQFQEPLNLCYLAAVLRRDGFDVHLLDAEFCDMDAPAILRAIADDRPKVVGVSLMSDGGLAGTLHIVQGVRQWAAPDAHIMVGGQYATFNTEYLFRMAPEIDSVVLFEGENVISPLVGSLVNKNGEWRATPGIAFCANGGGARVHRTNRAPPITDLDQLPYPARDLLPKATQLGLSPVVLSSRGCSGHCSFCTIHGFMRESSGAAWRGRSPQNVVDEITVLADNFQVGEIGFLDDDFIGTRNSGRARASAIADLFIAKKLDIIYNIECRPDMIERDLFAKLRDSGLRSVFVGVEGVTQSAVRAFRKGIPRDLACRALDILAELGIEFDVGFILYHPYCTLEEIWEGYEFLKQYGQCDVHTALNQLYVAPGAPIRERLISEGRLGGATDEFLHHTNGYEFLDERVAVLLAILRVVVFPIFPYWYTGIKTYRRLRAERKFSGAQADVDDRMVRLKSFTRGVDRVVEGCFEEAFRYAAGNTLRDIDMLGFARHLKEEVRAQTESLAHSTACDDCLGQV